MGWLKVGEAGMFCCWLHHHGKSRGLAFKNRKQAFTLMRYYVAMKAFGTFAGSRSAGICGHQNPVTNSWSVPM